MLGIKIRAQFEINLSITLKAWLGLPTSFLITSINNILKITAGKFVLRNV